MGIRNEFSGDARRVVQVGDVHGDLNVHGPASSGPSPDQLSRAAESLAVAVREQWRREAEARSLHRPRPLRLRWSEAGGIDDVVAKFRTAPHRQLVVLGKPGSGKTVTALLFTLGLLAARDRGDPVPVLLAVSSWNPRTEHLHAWVARRLEEDYKALTNRRVYGRDTAIRLVRDGLVVPVLDGLDELPADLHAKAIDRIDHATGSALPLVVTCRSEEYQAAVEAGGTTLSAADVVELRDVDVDDTIAFLSTVPSTSVARWKPVFDHLREHPDGPLAMALSTPLMVDLARTAYRDPATDPAELLEVPRFEHVDVIEHHLLDVFVPTKYAPDPAAPSTADCARPGRVYPPHRAEKWLTFLASDLSRRKVRELAWWELPAGRSSRFIVLIPVFLCGLLLRNRLGYLSNGLVLGLGVDVLGALLATKVVGHRSVWKELGHAFRSATSNHPRHINLRTAGRGRDIAIRGLLGLVIGAVLGAGMAFLAGQSLWGPTLWIALAAGMMTALEAWFAVPTDEFTVPDPAAALRHDRRSAGLLVLMAAVSLLGVLALIGVATGDFLRLFGGPAGVCWLMAFSVMYGVGYAWTSAWTSSLIARAWWALRGKLPWRLMAFLEDAHRRGVLRKAGMTYQFQHALLQNRLAGATEADTLGLHVLTAGNGFLGCAILDLFQDSAGRMWVGTTAGLAVCEDDDWSFSNHGSVVWRVRQDARGEVWAATSRGLCRWDDGRLVVEHWPDGSVRNFLFDREQRLWTSHGHHLLAVGGLHVFDGRTWKAAPRGEGAPGRYVMAIFEDSAGRIWVSSHDGLDDLCVSCWDGSSWRRFSRPDGLVSEVTSILEGPDGRMWFGTPTGVAIYDGTTWESLSVADGLIDNRIRSMFVDAAKTMWFGTPEGVSRFDGARWWSFTREDGLVDNRTSAIAQDRHGRLWFGARNTLADWGGIARTRRLFRE